MVSLELGVLFLCVPRFQKIQSFPINISLFYSYLLCPQYRRGGPIIAVQVENEYGSYNMDKKYMAFVKTVSALLLWSVILWRKHIPDACSLSGTVSCADGEGPVLCLIFGYSLVSGPAITRMTLIEGRDPH